LGPGGAKGNNVPGSGEGSVTVSGLTSSIAVSILAYGDHGNSFVPASQAPSPGPPGTTPPDPAPPDWRDRSGAPGDHRDVPDTMRNPRLPLSHRSRRSARPLLHMDPQGVREDGHPDAVPRAGQPLATLDRKHAPTRPVGHRAPEQRPPGRGCRPICPVARPIEAVGDAD